jgi:WD40 repeat protein
LHPGWLCTILYKQVVRSLWIVAALFGLGLFLGGCSVGLPSTIEAVSIPGTTGVVQIDRTMAVISPSTSPTSTPTTTSLSVSRPGTPVPDLSERIDPLTAGRLEEIARWGNGFPQGIAWSPAGDILVVASTRGLYFYENEGPALMQFVEDGASYRSLDYSPDGRTLAAGTDQGDIEIWDVPSLTMLRILEGHKSAVLDVAFAPGCGGSSCLLASASWDGTIRVWELPEGAMHNTMQAGGGVHQLAFGSDSGRLLSWSRERPVQVWNADSGTHEGDLGVGEGSLEWVALSDDGAALLVQSGDGGRVHSGDNGYTLFSLAELDVTSRQTAFSPDGKYLAIAQEASIQLRRMQDGVLIQSLHFENSRAAIGQLAFSPDSDMLAAVGDAVYLWDLSQVALREELRVDYSLDELTASPDAGSLVTWGAGSLTARLWTTGLSEGPKKGGLTDKQGIPIEDVVFSPDGDIFATAADAVRLWNTADQTLISTFVASAEDVEIRIKVFDPDSGETNFATFHNQIPISSVAFSPDGRMLAAGTIHRSIYLWAYPSGEPLGVLSSEQLLAGESQPIDKLAFSEDSQHLLAVTGSGRIELWDLPGEQLTQVILVEGLPEGSPLGPCRVWLSEGEVFAAWQDVTYRYQAVDGKLIESYAGRCGLRMGEADYAGSDVVALPGAALELAVPEAYPGLQGLTYLPDAQILVMARGSRRNLLVQLWQVKSEGQGALKSLAEQYSGLAGSLLDFHLDEQAATEVWSDGSLTHYSIDDGQISRFSALPGWHIKHAVSSPDGSMAAIATWDGRLLVQTSPEVPGTSEGALELAAGDYSRIVFSAGCSASADTSSAGERSTPLCFLAASDPSGAVELYDLPGGTLFGVLENLSPAYEMLFTRDGSLAAVRTSLGINVWRTANQEKILTLQGDSMDFSPSCTYPHQDLLGEDCLLAVSSSDQLLKKISLWRTADRSLLWSVEADKGNLSFSPDGALLAVAGTTLSMLDAVDGRLISSEKNPSPYGKLSFSPDGRLLGIAGEDGAVYLWGIRP